MKVPKKVTTVYLISPVWIKRFLENIFELIVIVYIKINLRRAKTIDDVLEVAFNSGIQPWQLKEEIKNLLLILNKAKPKVILEIGTGRGGTLFLFSNVAHEEAKLISVDLYQIIAKKVLFRYIVRRKQKAFLIQGDSHNVETLKKVEEVLKGNKVDFFL
jgi:cephalosporin hydroxylase